VGSGDTPVSFVIEIDRVALDGPSPMDPEVPEADAIGQLHTIALAVTPTPTDALRLLVLAACDFAEMASNTDEALTASIAMLRAWRDSGSPVPSAEELHAALPDVPVSPVTVDLFLDALDDSTEGS
jgi:hypothetical protein